MHFPEAHVHCCGAGGIGREAGPLPEASLPKEDSTAVLVTARPAGSQDAGATGVHLCPCAACRRLQCTDQNMRQSSAHGGLQNVVGEQGPVSSGEVLKRRHSSFGRSLDIEWVLSSPAGADAGGAPNHESEQHSGSEQVRDEEEARGPAASLGLRLQHNANSAFLGCTRLLVALVPSLTTQRPPLAAAAPTGWGGGWRGGDGP